MILAHAVLLLICSSLIGQADADESLGKLIGKLLEAVYTKHLNQHQCFILNFRLSDWKAETK